MAYLLALDQGTSSSRSIVFDETGAIRGRSQAGFRQIYPRPGWVEHDPRDILQTQLATARQALKQAGVSAGALAAIGIANQRETVILWDRATGTPLHHAIVWQDRRTAPMISRLKATGCETAVTAKTGLLLDPYFSATKMAWLLDHVDGARDRAERGELAAGTVDSWLLWNLSGGQTFLTDITNASRTLLFNIHTLKWDEELLDLFGVPAPLLPEVRPSGGFFADSASDVLGAAVPVTGTAGDQQAALFGQHCTEPGMAKNTYGTGCFILMQTGNKAVASRNRLLTTVAWQFKNEPARYALEGSVFIAGAAIQWLRDGLGVIQSAGEISELAATVPDTGGVTVVPAFTGLGAPHWRPEAQGLITGITRGTTAAHIARATLEAIACQSADVLRAMEADTGEPLRELRADGGAAASDLLMQLQADLLGIPVCRPKVIETTALGAACLAGLAAGVWPQTGQLENGRQAARIFEPAISDTQRRELRDRWAAAVSKA